MTDLHISLLALGALFILAVIGFNAWQERKARGRAERAFGEVKRDALFDAPRAADRREPTLGAVAPPPAAPATEVAPMPTPAEPAEPGDLEAGGPAAQIASRIDTVAVILADDPIMKEQLDPLAASLRTHSTPVHIEGIVDEQWHPVEESTRRSWRELRVGLQLASRAGPVAEDEIERFNHAISEFAASVNAVSQREAPAAAAARARDLDRFCADADIEVAVNVVGQFGATFAVSRVKQLALEHGMSETASGGLVSFAGDGSVEFVVRAMESLDKAAATTYFNGITFALDLPNVADPAAVLDDMVQVAQSFAANLAGQVVDDNRRPLTEAGIASIRRSLEKIARDMEAHGVPAGSPLARRLFS